MKPALLLLTVVATTPAHAFELSSKGDFQCKITIEGEVKLDGPCSYYPDMAEGFDVTDGKGLVVTLRMENGGARLYWNGPDHGPYPDIPLGRASRSGTCWVNKKAAVCAVNPAL